MICHFAQNTGNEDVKKTRYVKQKDECSCGPIALLNLKKWLDESITSSDLSKIKKDMGWPFGLNPNLEGTPSIHMTIYALKFLKKSFLKHSQYKINVSLKQKIKTLTNHLDSNHAIILAHPALSHPKSKIENWHYSLLIKEKNHYLGINYYKDASAYTISIDEIKLLFRRGGKAIEYWVFTK